MNYEYVTSQDRLGHVANRIDANPVLELDIETTALRPWKGLVRLLSLRAGDERFVIDLFKTGKPEAVLQAIANPKTVKVIQNAKFEQLWFLHHFGIELWPIFDTFRASAIIYNGKQVANDLFSIQERELGVAPGLDLGGSGWGGELTQQQLQYSADDVEHLGALRTKFKATLTKLSLNHTALVEFGAVLPEASIELNGFYLDRDRWLTLCDKNIVREKELRKQLAYVLPHPKGQVSLPGFEDTGFNFGSTQMLQKSLSMLGVEVESTSKAVLSAVLSTIKKKSVREAVALVMEYKTIRKRLDSFGPAYLDNIDPLTGRIHASFYPFTEAGRYSCSAPNLQQLPRLAEFRDCFRAQGSNYFGVWDYSQIELRIAADISQDPAMIRAYRNGLDLHILTASLLNDCSIEEVTKAMRQPAKAGNFGLLYGMGAEKLAAYAHTNYGVDMSRREAEEFKAKFFQGYSGLKKWHRSVFSDENRRNGYTRTVGGRIRFLNAHLFSEFANSPVQGTGADGMKRALRIVYEKFRKYGNKALMVNMVHDEIASEVSGSLDAETLEQVDLDVKQGMIEGMQCYMNTVPVVVEGGFGDSWADK